MTPLIHPVTRRQIDGVVARPKGSYIFFGPQGIGKSAAAAWVARLLHCGGQESCQNCHLVLLGNHPDFITVKPEEKQSIGIAQIQELQHALSLSIQDSKGHRVVLIEDADALTTEAQNCLLKTIEEPPVKTLIILAASEPLALLATVRSRCQHIGFLPLPKLEIKNWLEAETAVSPDVAQSLAELSGGAPGFAINLAKRAEHLEQFMGLAEQIRKFPEQPKFERLLAASKLAESSIDPKLLKLILISQTRLWISQAAHGSPDEIAPILMRVSAVEEFWQNIKANVSLKTALSGLVVQL